MEDAEAVAVIQKVLFLIMCYADADEGLCPDLMKIFEPSSIRTMIAQTLLHIICKKRKDMLQRTMEFLMQVTPVTSIVTIMNSLYCVFYVLLGFDVRTTAHCIWSEAWRISC